MLLAQDVRNRNPPPRSIDVRHRLLTTWKDRKLTVGYFKGDLFGESCQSFPRHQETTQRGQFWVFSSGLKPCGISKKLVVKDYQLDYTDQADQMNASASVALSKKSAFDWP